VLQGLSPTLTLQPRQKLIFARHETLGLKEKGNRQSCRATRKPPLGALFYLKAWR
jgi:hypothetical protein